MVDVLGNQKDERGPWRLKKKKEKQKKIEKKS